MTNTLKKPPFRRASLLLAAFACVVLLSYVVTPDGIFGSKAQGDGWYGFHYLPATVLHQTLDMRMVSPTDRIEFDTGQKGRGASRNPIGPALVMLPVYTLTVLLEAVLRPILPSSFSGPPFDINFLQVFWTGLITAAAGVLAMVLLYRLLCRHLRRDSAVVGAVVAVYATPIFWYLTIQPHYQHGLAFAAVTLLIERWDAGRGQTHPRRFLLLGLYGGLAMLMRAQELVFLLAPGSEILWALLVALRQRRGAEAVRWLRGGVLLLVGAAIAFLPQILCWSYYFGWFKRPVNIEIMRPFDPALWEVLFSMKCGLFPWSPVVYLSLIGLMLAARKARHLVVPLLVVLAADIYLVAASWMWYGSFGFGSRRLSDCAPIFGLGVGLLWQRVGPIDIRWLRRTLLGIVGTLLVLFVSLNLLLVDLMRRRVIPSSGSRARPAYQWAQLAGAPDWLVSALRPGYPFVQPAGLIFALRHRVPVTAWEAVVGNYALEREPHDYSVSGNVWKFDHPETEAHVAEGLLPMDSSTPTEGRPVSRHIRVLLQPFGREPIRGAIVGDLPRGEVVLRWNGQRISWTHFGGKHLFSVPLSLVRPHSVAELTIELPEPPSGQTPRIQHIQLFSYAAWWKRVPPEDANPPPIPMLRLRSPE